MPDISIEEALKLPIPKSKKPKPISIEEALSAPVVGQPQAPTPPAPGFLENLKIGGQRALLSAADAGRVMEDAINAVARGDFAPLGQLVEQIGRGATPLISAASGRPELAAQNFLLEQSRQAPRVGEIARAREERMDTDPTLFSREARAERARLDELAGRDPSLAGKITRRATEGVLTAVPSIVAGAATGGSATAMAAMAGLQSMNTPEMLIPNVALAAVPIPVGRAVAPLVRRIKAGRTAAEAIPVTPPSSQTLTAAVLPETAPVSIEAALAAPEIPAIQAQTAIPAPDVVPPVSSPPLAPRAALTAAQQEAAALNSAVQKLGTDGVDEIAEMIANANRRFNKTVTTPGQPKRAITPIERESMREDYGRVSALTKAENDALAGVLPERTYAPVNKLLVEGEPTARAISDIPLDEPSAQLDANLRQLKAFFDAQSGQAPAPATDQIIERMAGLQRSPASPVSITQLRSEFPGMSKPDFDSEMARLADADQIALTRYDYPASLPEAERNTLVRIGDDYYGAATFPNGPPTIGLGRGGASSVSVSGPRVGEIAPMEIEIGRQLRQAAPGVARNMEPLEVGSMERARQAPLFDPQRNLDPLNVGSMRSAEQLPLLDVKQKNTLRKALNLAADLYQIPKSMMSSADISFPFRQGAILMIPPSRWGLAKKSLVEMFRALVPDRPTSLKGGIKAQFQTKTERFQRMVDAIASDPDAQLGQNSGLKLSSQDAQGFRRADGEFMSDAANRIPVVRESQQAYTMAADFTRLNTFKLYKQTIDKAAAQQGFSADQVKRGYEAAARWINVASGRGNFGEKFDRALDALSFFAFSPRFFASRLQVLSPLTYLRNAGTAEGRAVLKMQMSEMAQMTAMVGGTLLLAKAAGFKVGTNPEKPDFLRISLGNYHYDGLAGLQPVMRLIYGVAADAARAARGEKAVEGKTALDIGARFLRSKAAPIPSAFIDYFDRKTFEGKPFDLTDAALERLTPMMWQDFAEAHEREGLAGPLKLSPGAVGFGAQYFEPKPIDAAIEARPGLLTELTRLQVRLADPRKKPDETDAAYKGRQEAVANLYGRYGVSLMSDRDYANLPDTEKRDVFDLLHSRISDAVNTRDRRTAQFKPDALIRSLRKSARQKTIRERLISRRPPL
jgi:hypothetical protein